MSSRAPPAVHAASLIRHGQFHVIVTANSNKPAENRSGTENNSDTNRDIKYNRVCRFVDMKCMCARARARACVHAYVDACEITDMTN